MSSVFSVVALAAALVMAGNAAAPLRVCADPNNLPYSNRAEAGFENAIAHIVADALHRPLAYRWMPQRRGFIRQGLNAGVCDVVMGMPTASPMVLSTRPYYRSSYVFVTRPSTPVVRSFDDRSLARMTVGVQIIGDDYDNSPAAEALARRGLVDRVRGFPVYGDYSTAVPMRPVVDAVISGAVDVAVVWGPLAGYLASLTPSAGLVLRPVVAGARDAALPFVFDIGMAVRRNDTALAQTLNAALGAHRRDIGGVLRRFHVPVMELDAGRTRS
jgi:mxaJ protein